MALIKPPEAGQDVCELWKDVATLAKFINALDQLKVSASQTRNKLTLTESTATLELMLGAAAAGAASYPWQAAPSAWTGPGADPNAATRALRFGLVWGSVNNQTPSNMNGELVAFGDITNTTITQAQAVVTFVYWRASVYETATGQGDFQMDQPVILTAQGGMADNLTALVSPPDFGADGSLPSYVIGQICVVQNYGGALHFPPGLNAYLNVLPVVTGALDGTVTRQFQYTT